MKEDKAEKEHGMECGWNRILCRYGARKPLAGRDLHDWRESGGASCVSVHVLVHVCGG